MISLDDYASLKRRVAELQRESDQAKGALEQVKVQLKDQFGVTSLKEAKTLLAKYSEEEQEAYKEYVEAKKAFEEKWKEQL